MDLAGYRAALRREGDLLAAALPRVDQHAHPPGCPDWRVVDVVRHLGYVHRWAAAVVRERRADGEVDVADDGAGISGPALVDWFRAGHDALLRELAACDPAAVFFAFLPAPSALHFWSRRQTHETGIHRTDVESAGGPVTPFPAEQAVDGIEEILTGFAARPRPRWRGPERSLGLLASDPGTPGWLVRIGSDGARVERGDEDATTAECVVRGGASDLDLLLWNRIDPAGLDVRGDPGVLDAWRGTVRVRWTGPPPPGAGAMRPTKPALLRQLGPAPAGAGAWDHRQVRSSTGSRPSVPPSDSDTSTSEPRRDPAVDASGPADPVGGDRSGPAGPAGPASAGWGLWVRLAAAATAGGALVLAFPPYDLWPLAVGSVAALALLTRGMRVRYGALLGLGYGLAFFVPLLSWSGIYVGPAPWLLLAVSQAAFAAALGAGLAATSALPAAPLSGAVLWVAAEAARSRLPFGGFPWGRLAFSQADSPLSWLAAYGGAPLVTFAVALLGGLLAAAVTAAAAGPRRWQRLAVPLSAAAAVLGLTAGAALAGDWQTTAVRQVTVALVQGNVPRLGLDFNAQREAVLRNHVEATLRLARDVEAGRVPRPGLVLWPENASDIDPIRFPDARALIDRAARAVGVPILVGTLAAGPTPDTIRNVGIVWDPNTGPGERYVKRHPVPFGEYIPFRRIARLVSEDVDRVRRDFLGGDRAGRLVVGPATVGDVICFEVAYDGLIRDVADSDLLVVQTNNATFGRSSQTWQQLAMGRLRAVEHGRPVLVAATSGVSAVIRPDGHVSRRSDVFTADVLVEAVGVRTGSTLATRLGAGPEWLAVAAALGVMAAGVVAGRRRAGRRNSPGRSRKETE